MHESGRPRRIKGSGACPVLSVSWGWPGVVVGGGGCAPTSVLSSVTHSLLLEQSSAGAGPESKPVPVPFEKGLSICH